MSAPEISVAPHIGNSGVHRTKRNSDPSETLACFLINSCPTSTITSRKLFTAIYGYTRIESKSHPCTIHKLSPIHLAQPTSPIRQNGPRLRPQRLPGTSPLLSSQCSLHATLRSMRLTCGVRIISSTPSVAGNVRS